VAKREKEGNPYFDRVKRRTKPCLVLNEEGVRRVEELSSIGCEDAEIAMELGVSLPTLRTEANREIFSAAKEKGRCKYLESIRRRAYTLMEKGSVPMTIFLCKAVLGMSDRPERELPEASPLDDLAEELEGYERWRYASPRTPRSGRSA